MIETLTTFFLFGGIGFWILAVIASIIFIVGCEMDTLGLSIFATIVLAVLSWKAILIAVSNPIILTVAIVAYLVIGVLNSCWRLRVYAKKVVEDYNKNPNLYPYPERALRLSENKSRITSWIIYWPWSAFWNLAGDFFTSLYKAMSGIYQRIIDGALVNLKKETSRTDEDSFVSRRR